MKVHLNATPEQRIFVAVGATSLNYADRAVEENGDYRTLARLGYRLMDLRVHPQCPPHLYKWIMKDVERYRRGELFQVSACNQTIMWGHALCCVCDKEVNDISGGRGMDGKMKHWECRS